MSRKRRYEQCNCGGCTTNGRRSSADDDLLILPDSSDLTTNAAAPTPLYIGDCLELSSDLELVANMEQDRARRKKLRRQDDANGQDDDIAGLGLEDPYNDEDLVWQAQQRRASAEADDDEGDEDEDEDDDYSGENRRRLGLNSRHSSAYIGSDPLILD